MHRQKLGEFAIFSKDEKGQSRIDNTDAFEKLDSIGADTLDVINKLRSLILLERLMYLLKMDRDKLVSSSNLRSQGLHQTLLRLFTRSWIAVIFLKH